MMNKVRYQVSGVRCQVSGVRCQNRHPAPDTRHPASGEAGFSLVDVMIAIALLLIGVLAMISAMTSAIIMTTQNQQAVIAKQLATSTMEAIYSARDIDDEDFGWDAIGNVGSASVPDGVFPTGEQPLYPTAGEDGIVGTADDANGPDGEADSGDEGEPMTGFTREIVITDVPDPVRPTAPITLRQIDVRIRYLAGRSERQESISSYVAFYRTSDEE